MTPEERALLIKRYEDGYAAFAEVLDSVPEAGLDFAPPREWSARQIAHHVADAELVRGYRLRQLLAQAAPLLQGFDEEQFVARLHYYRPVDASLALFRAAAESNIELLTLVFPEDWARSGRHEEFGEFTLEDWLQRAASHAYEHAEQLRSLS
ncbi:MAG TPA: DinB family protein [Dehalococcoidia bacterium]|nr:DinB family protein [Dehalococcoidia bacterium]